VFETIRDFMINGGDFNSTALALWGFQVEHNVHYGRFCGSKRPKNWMEIPAVPVGLFRDILFTTFPPFLGRVRFQTSGTTGKRGIHLLKDTQLYDLGAQHHMENILGGIPTTGLSLVSPAPDSSLGHMCRYFAPKMLQGFDLDVGVRHDACWAFLKAAKEAVFVPGTAFAFDSLLSNAHPVISLPKGSVIMVTGGFKGRKSILDGDDLKRALLVQFPGTRIVGEYGMTELSSQLWSTTLGVPFIPPHWLKVLAVDEETGQPTSGCGILRFFDLANHQSVMAIETRDLGVVDQMGHVTLYGRREQAPARGCSLTVEEVDNHFNRRQRTVPKTAPKNKWERHTQSLKLSETLSALNELQHEPISPMGQGLSSENAQWGLRHAISSITENGLRHLLSNSERPKSVAIVVAHGVFTSPLEWIAIAAASGADVLVKAPSNGPELCQTFCRILAKNGLSIRCSTDHNLGAPDLIIAFGSDESIQKIRQEYPNTALQSHGHRFSLAIVNDDIRMAPQLARDICAYNTRGCMAPVATFVLGDVTQWERALSQALAEDAQQFPKGDPESHLGHESRRRHGLARISGRIIENPDWTILTLPPEHFYPSALPRTAVLHPFNQIEDVWDILSPWKNQLSGLAWGLKSPSPINLCRITSLGELQKPAFPRIHDGQRMWPLNMPPVSP
jgi:hypothetical protein